MGFERDINVSVYSLCDNNVFSVTSRTTGCFVGMPFHFQCLADTCINGIPVARNKQNVLSCKVFSILKQ